MRRRVYESDGRAAWMVRTNAAVLIRKSRAYFLRRGGVQFSVTSSPTRSNSAVLFVTSLSPSARAWAAISRSLAISAPRFSRFAPISA